MQRHRISIINPEMTYYLWDMPEIVDEIPSLFVEAGETTLKKLVLSRAVVQVKLKHPIKIVSSSTMEHGLTINSSTYVSMNSGVCIRLFRLPQNDDVVINFAFDLQLETLLESREFTLDDLRNAIKEVATLMTKPWYLT